MIRASSALTNQLLGEEAGTQAQDLVAPLEDVRTRLGDLREDPSEENVNEQVAGMRETVTTLETNFQRFSTVDAGVLVRPFESDVDLAVEGVSQVTDWYAPAAVVLMLQQFGVAFGALSFVRERRLGIVDVYRVAPVNATATLIGKYLAYMLIGSGIGAALTGLVVGLLNVPVAAERLGGGGGDGAEPVRVDRRRLRHLPCIGERRASSAVHDDPPPREPLLQRLLPLHEPVAGRCSMGRLPAARDVRDAAAA
jgi:hypothetical protein